MKRRELIQLSLSLLGAAANASVTSALAAGITTGGETAGEPALDGAQRRTVELLCGMIIPPTDTPGAVAAGVPAFVDVIVGEWYTQDERDAFVAGLATLDVQSLALEGEPFHRATPAARLAILSEHAESAAEQEDAFFTALRELVVLGYFTSEIGARQALAYLPVPGHYDGDYDFARVGKSWTR